MWKYLSLAGVSTWKYLFAPIIGAAAGLSFWETVIYCLIGGCFSATVTYFGSKFIIELLSKRKNSVKENAKKRKKVFTKKNRVIIKIKQKLGRYFVYWAFPLFLSIPIGTTIVSKFYRHHKETFPFILFFLTIDCFLISALAYLF